MHPLRHLVKSSIIEKLKWYHVRQYRKQAFSSSAACLKWDRHYFAFDTWIWSRCSIHSTSAIDISECNSFIPGLCILCPHCPFNAFVLHCNQYKLHNSIACFYIFIFWHGRIDITHDAIQRDMRHGEPHPHPLAYLILEHSRVVRIFIFIFLRG